MEISLKSPKTVVLQPQHLAVILDLLAGAPYKIAEPIIADIFKQLKEQETT